MYRLVAWFDSMPRGVKMLFYMFLIALVLGGQLLLVNLYVTKLESKVDSTNVVRVKATAKEIGTHTVITADMVEIKRVRLEDVLPGGFAATDDVVGKEATVPLQPKEQITESKINVALKREGETTIEFPNAWLLSFPQSLRKLDKIRLWVAGDPKDIKNLKSSTVSKDQPNQISSSTDVNFQVSMQAEISDITKNQEPLLKDITVSYFKDASANDIVDPTDSSAPRVKASGVGNRLELSFTEQQWAAVRDLAMKGYKFVVGY